MTNHPPHGIVGPFGGIALRINTVDLAPIVVIDILHDLGTRRVLTLHARDDFRERHTQIKGRLTALSAQDHRRRKGASHGHTPGRVVHRVDQRTFVIQADDLPVGCVIHVPRHVPLGIRARHHVVCFVVGVRRRQVQAPLPRIDDLLRAAPHDVIAVLGGLGLAEIVCALDHRQHMALSIVGVLRAQPKSTWVVIFRGATGPIRPTHRINLNNLDLPLGIVLDTRPDASCILRPLHPPQRVIAIAGREVQLARTIVRGARQHTVCRVVRRACDRAIGLDLLPHTPGMVVASLRMRHLRTGLTIGQRRAGQVVVTVVGVRRDVPLAIRDLNRQALVVIDRRCGNTLLGRHRLTARSRVVAVAGHVPQRIRQTQHTLERIIGRLGLSAYAVLHLHLTAKTVVLVRRVAVAGLVVARDQAAKCIVRIVDGNPTLLVSTYQVAHLVVLVGRRQRALCINPHHAPGQFTKAVEGIGVLVEQRIGARGTVAAGVIAP